MEGSLKRSREELVSLVRKMLPEKRFFHTLAVEEEALFLANELEPDASSDISRAALLHDVTKYFSKEEHLALCHRLSPDDEKSPETLHALTGAEYARSVLFESDAVCRMIERHTTADADMTLSELIVFVADYTEKTRAHDSCKRERELLHATLALKKSREEKIGALKESAIRILESTVGYLKEKKSFIHPRTILALESLKERASEE